MVFEEVELGRPDMMYDLKVAADNDTSPQKVDLGVGVYRSENGVYEELDVLRRAKVVLTTQNPSHEYEITTGNPDFLHNAAKVCFGDDSQALKNGQVASVQTISGTGACHLAALFLQRVASAVRKIVYVGVPAWGNYEPLCKLAGLEIRFYNHVNVASGEIDFESMMQAVHTAEEGSIFILQGCCHNPTAADLTRDQWNTLAQQMLSRKLFPFFDTAYQGLGDGLDEDSYGMRLFSNSGFEMLVCQTFAKNFGLYGERVGALHVQCHDQKSAAAVFDQLRCLIRWEFSSAPAYGSRLVNLVLSDESAKQDWYQELEAMRLRLKSLRTQLYHLLSDVYQTPGDWSFICRGKGLFSMLPLNPAQCKQLSSRYHIYLVSTGRITISGLNNHNIEYVAKCLDTVVREHMLVQDTLQRPRI